MSLKKQKCVDYCSGWAISLRQSMTRHNFISLFFMGVWKKLRRVNEALGVSRLPAYFGGRLIAKWLSNISLRQSMTRQCVYATQAAAAVHFASFMLHNVSFWEFISGIWSGFAYKFFDIYTLWLVNQIKHPFHKIWVSKWAKDANIQIHNYQQSQFPNVWKSANFVISAFIVLWLVFNLGSNLLILHNWLQ